MQNNSNVSAIKTASGFNLLLGLWLIIAPFLLNYLTPAARGNDITIGVTIAILAAVRVFGAYRAASLQLVQCCVGIVAYFSSLPTPLFCSNRILE